MKINSKIYYHIRQREICCNYNKNLNNITREHHVILGRVNLGDRNDFCNLVFFVLGEDILTYHMAALDVGEEEQYAPYKIGKYLAAPVLYLIDIL